MEIKAGSNRLFDYDCRIVVNGIRATFAPWRDRLTVGIGLFVIIAVVRAWFADRPWTVAAWVGLAAGGLIGVTAGQLIASRLAFHAFDGALTADALHLPTRRRYIIVWHAIGLGILAIVTLVVRPSLVIVSLPGYAAGALIGGGTFGFAVPGLAIVKLRYGRTVRSWAQRPHAGIVAAATLCLSLMLLARFLGTNALIALASIEAAMLALALTVVDDGIVRFLTANGHRSWRIIARQARGVVLFTVVAAPICAFAFGTIVAGIVAIVSTAALVLMTTRILAYRLHGKRSADVLVSVLMALLMLVAFSMPAIMPLVAIVMVWQLQRRAATRTWMLA
ncbi:hypothetical protein [Sphingomonas sp.]|jgi:hypothetical protein|uniref:hypothetical protein n=1 Tax=Sphingomonas sp. TaxID=28214 RepID=UPI0035616D1E